MRRGRWALAVVLVAVVAPAAVLLLLRGLPSSPAPSSTQPSPLASAELARIAPAAAAHPAGEWRIPAGDYASSRYSAMADIDRSNVARLKPAFSFDTGVKRGHEAPPLVIGSTMYIVTPFPNYVYAIDLAQRTIRSNGASIPSRRSVRRGWPAAMWSTAA